VELFCAAQALDFHRPLTSSPTLEAVHAHVRQHIPHADVDRRYGEDILAAAGVIRSRELLRIVEEYAPDAFSSHDTVFEQY
jgi:histidine ammonia-lyase